jgi:hypothetical protein
MTTLPGLREATMKPKCSFSEIVIATKHPPCAQAIDRPLYVKAAASSGAGCPDADAADEEGGGERRFPADDGATFTVHARIRAEDAAIRRK